MIVNLSSEQLVQTVAKLQNVGKSGREFMVFWLGVREKNSITIKEVYTPLQKTSRMTIQISEKGMRELFGHLRETRLMLAAQVHIHPKEAFHSDADDFLAILRHQDALSMVLPWFGLRTTPRSFFDDTACYIYTPDGRWEKTNVRNHVKLK